MTNGGNAIDWLKEKFLGKTPAYQPQPARFIAPTPRPVPIPVPSQTLPAAPESAGLVSSRSHAKGRLEDTGSLIGGR